MGTHAAYCWPAWPQPSPHFPGPATAALPSPHPCLLPPHRPPSLPIHHRSPPWPYPHYDQCWHRPHHYCPPPAASPATASPSTIPTTTALPGLRPFHGHCQPPWNGRCPGLSNHYPSPASTATAAAPPILDPASHTTIALVDSGSSGQSSYIF